MTPDIKAFAALTYTVDTGFGSIWCEGTLVEIESQSRYTSRVTAVLGDDSRSFEVPTNRLKLVAVLPSGR